MTLHTLQKAKYNDFSTGEKKPIKTEELESQTSLHRLVFINRIYLLPNIFTTEFIFCSA